MDKKWDNQESAGFIESKKSSLVVPLNTSKKKRSEN